jgi:hypothetical protein
MKDQLILYPLSFSLLGECPCCPATVRATKAARTSHCLKPRIKEKSKRMKEKLILHPLFFCL